MPATDCIVLASRRPGRQAEMYGSGESESRRRRGQPDPALGGEPAWRRNLRSRPVGQRSVSDQLPGARGRGLGAAAGVNVEWQTRARWRVSHPTRAKTGRRGRSGTGPQRARFRWTREQMSASAFIRCRVGCSDAPSRDRRRGGRTPQTVLSLLGGRSWDQVMAPAEARPSRGETSGGATT